MTGYTLRLTERFQRRRDQQVVNQFHPAGVRVDLIRPELLMVPTGKSLTDPPPPYTPGIDHFLCYRVRGGSFLRNAVTATDQFGTITVGVKRALRLCVPVNKNNEGILDGSRALMCYKARSRSGPPTDNSLLTTNQLEDATDFVFGLRELCVPSLLNPGAGTPTPTITSTPTLTATPTPAATSTPISCGAGPTCAGDCPAGRVCSTTAFLIGQSVTCECVPGSVPCAGLSDPTFPTCGGACAAGLVCESLNAAGTGCLCTAPDQLCTTCGGGFVCAPGQTCRIDITMAGFECGCFAD